MNPHDATELAAAFLQAGITICLVTICLYLYARYHRAYFVLWALAWFLYALRLGAIISFLVSEQWGWPDWHQVLTGWTALAFLWALRSCSASRCNGGTGTGSSSCFRPCGRT